MKHLLNYLLFIENTKNPSITKNLHVGQHVRYKDKGYDSNISPDKQSNKVGKGKIEKINPENGIVTIKDNQGQEFKKSANRVLSPNADELLKVTKEIKQLLRGQVKYDLTKLKIIRSFIRQANQSL